MHYVAYFATLCGLAVNLLLLFSLQLLQLLFFGQEFLSQTEVGPKQKVVIAACLRLLNLLGILNHAIGIQKIRQKILVEVVIVVDGGVALPRHLVRLVEQCFAVLCEHGAKHEVHVVVILFVLTLLHIFVSHHGIVEYFLNLLHNGSVACLAATLGLILQEVVVIHIAPFGHRVLNEGQTALEA